MIDSILLEMGRIRRMARGVRQQLEYDQSLLTGETEPAIKEPTAAQQPDGTDNPACIYRGTHVVEGQGEMLVVPSELRPSSGKSPAGWRTSRRKDAAQDVALSQDSESDRVRRKLNLAKVQNSPPGEARTTGWGH